MTGGDLDVAAEGPEKKQRRRVRVKRRVAPVLSRTRKRYLTALVIAVVAALAVAAFVGASLDAPETYVPGGAIR